jgi:MOSC domain-containing protein YiiM
VPELAGLVLQLSVSPGGVPKRAIAAARVSRRGLEGDAHRDARRHGGPERAVCLFPWEAIQALVAEGHALGPGTIGENITTHRLDWALVVPGAHLLLGEQVLLQVTRYASPCKNIAFAFRGHDGRRVSQRHHPGCSRVYARVLMEGELRPGDGIRLVHEGEAKRFLAVSGGRRPVTGPRRRRFEPAGREEDSVYGSTLR